MKVYILYTCNWGNTCPLHISIDRAECEAELLLWKNINNERILWIEEYDFSEAKGFDLDWD